MKKLLLIGVCLIVLLSFASAKLSPFASPSGGEGEDDENQAVKFVGGGCDGSFYSSGSGDGPAPIVNDPTDGGAPVKSAGEGGNKKMLADWA